MYGLIDCNNFYASCERVFRPDLRNQPVVVLSNNDGCVIARSNEAKKLGISMAAPAYQFQELFDKHNVAVFSANFVLYGDMSFRVMSILSLFAPEMEIYSIDEAFMKLDGMERLGLKEFGLKISYSITKGTGIPVSLGFAPTKALAKVANRIAKKFPSQTQGVHIIDTEEKRIKALKWLPVEEVWGIGSRHAKRLKALQVKTAYDFTLLPDGWVRQNMSIVGLKLKNELLGVASNDLEVVKPKQNIATTRSFEKNYTQYEELKERITTFAVTCSEKLRKQHSHCNAIMVFLLTNNHRADQPQYNRHIVVKLPYPSNSSIELAKFAIDGLTKIFKTGFGYKKAGVIVMDITSTDKTQLNLFENSDPRHKPLMEAVDKINHGLGEQKVRLASQDLKRTWKMRQERLSARFTTRLSEVLVVNCSENKKPNIDLGSPNEIEPELV